ncbi:unnamed protein product [Plutella xylostella]|uniref:(diamondback moth) hypothetical protein n=1 Tax=Plutella xylostella TaxID=51655 RepID=A0A8S4GAC6_PLUXY|nr:unnamed protein product [Plutella xylostella]
MQGKLKGLSQWFKLRISLPFPRVVRDAGRRRHSAASESRSSRVQIVTVKGAPEWGLVDFPSHEWASPPPAHRHVAVHVPAPVPLREVNKC